MAARDAMEFINEQDDATLQRFVERLESSYAPVIARFEYVAPEQVDAWLAGLRQASEDGVFFAACNYYAYIASG